MKIALSVVVFVLGMSANAAVTDSKVILSDGNTSLSLMHTDYKFNPALGRAWFELWLNDSSFAYSDAAVGTYKERVLVNGLSYDAANSQIVFDAPQGRVVCAKVTTQTHRIRRPTVQINPTGAC